MRWPYRQLHPIFSSQQIWLTINPTRCYYLYPFKGNHNSRVKFYPVITRLKQDEAVRHRQHPGALLLLGVALLSSPGLLLVGGNAGTPTCRMSCCARMARCCCRGPRDAESKPSTTGGALLHSAQLSTTCPRTCVGLATSTRNFRLIQAAPLINPEPPIPRILSCRNGHPQHRRLLLFAHTGRAPPSA